MRITEFAASIIMISLSVLVFSYSVFIERRARRQIMSMSADSSVLIDTDSTIRNIGGGYRMNYLMPKEKELQKLIFQIRSYDFREGVAIEDIKVLKENGKHRLRVKWNYKGSKHETDFRVF